MQDLEKLTKIVHFFGLENIYLLVVFLIILILTSFLNNSTLKFKNFEKSLLFTLINLFCVVLLFIFIELLAFTENLVILIIPVLILSLLLNFIIAKFFFKVTESKKIFWGGIIFMISVFVLSISAFIFNWFLACGPGLFGPASC